MVKRLLELMVEVDFVNSSQFLQDCLNGFDSNVILVALELLNIVDKVVEHLI